MSSLASKVGALHLDGYNWTETRTDPNPHFVCKKGTVRGFVMSRSIDGAQMVVRYCEKCDQVLGVSSEREVS